MWWAQPLRRLENRGACRRLRKSPFLTILGLIMLTLAIGGFWPQYFRAVTGRATFPMAPFRDARAKRLELQTFAKDVDNVEPLLVMAR